MKKLLACASLAAFALPVFALAFTPNATSVNFQNVTTTGATVSIVPGNDTIGSYVFNRQPIRLKIRAISASEGLAPQLNGSEKEYPLSYSIDSNQPVYPLSLSGLKTNQKYAVWIGHQVVTKCYSSDSCNTVSIAYDTNPYLFSTLLNPSTVSVLSKNLAFQQKSSDVVILKKYLSANGYIASSSTTTFDVPTLVGVIKFQIANSLTTDGVVGSGSRNIINAWLLKQAQN